MRKASATVLAAAVCLAQVQPAYAQIVNSVTVTGNFGSRTLESSATETVTVAPAIPALTLVKSGSFDDGGDGAANVGDIITYAFAVTNSGTVRLTNVTLTDPLVAVEGGPITLLEPGATDSTTFTATYALTAADIEAGTVTNTATASGLAPDGTGVSDDGTAETAFAASGQIALEKTAELDDGGDGRADAGDIVTYRFVVTNTGDTVLHDVTVNDPLLEASAGPVSAAAKRLAGVEGAADPITTGSTTKLAAAGSATTALHAVSTWHEWFSSVTRFLPRSQALPPANADVRATRLLLQLSGEPQHPQPGDQVAIVLGVTNTGETPITLLAAAQGGAERFTAPEGLLAPGASDTASAIFTRTLTAADVAAGQLAAPAVIQAEARGRTLLRVLREPLALAAMSHADAMATASITPDSIPKLRPGESVEFTATYALTQADVDTGRVDNTATATGKDRAGRTYSAVDSATVTYDPRPGIALLKTAQADFGADGAPSVGDIVTYRFAVTNTGNVTLHNITVSDPKVPVTGGPLESLAPGQTDDVTFIARYPLTLEDLITREVINQATVSGTPDSGDAVGDLSDPSNLTGDEPTRVPLEIDPKIALVKQAGPLGDVNGNGRADAGETLTYRFTVTNTGNVTLTNIVVTDPLVTVSGGPIASLAPGASDATTFTATYVIVQDDIDRGEVTNQATVTGDGPDGVPVTDLSDSEAITGDGTTITPLDEAPSIALVKQVASIDDRNGNELNDAGDVINYRFTVFNTGNVTLSQIIVTDPLVTVDGGPLDSLAPGAIDTTTFTASYTITDADMRQGRVTNQARVQGRSPKGTGVEDLSDVESPEGDTPTIVPLVVTPSIAIVKSVKGILNANGNGLTDAGDIIQYVFTVTNTGNVTLTNVTVSDPLVTVSGGPLATLLAGAIDDKTFTAEYTITEDDMLAGRVVNQATASGTSPDNVTVSDLSDDSSPTEDDPTITPLGNTPRIALIKRVSKIIDSNSNGRTDAGDVIVYAFAVTNTGNVILRHVTVTDPLVQVDGGPLAELAVGQTDATTFTAAYTITAKDVDAGGVTNQATAVGEAPDGSAVSDISDTETIEGDDPTFTPIGFAPAIALVKSVSRIEDRNGNGLTDAGDIINYAFAVTNTGNVTLTGVTVTDPLVAVSGGPLAELLAGATDRSTFTARYTITAADAIAGEVRNQATASGTDPDGERVDDLSHNDDVTADGPTITPVERTKPNFTKTALDDEIRRGERVAFEIAATNVGAGPYDIIDIMPPGFTFVEGSATANGEAVAPVIRDRRLLFKDLLPDASATITLKLSLLVSTTLSTGRHVNNAQLVDPDTGDVIATAKAHVTITDEHVFDCGEIIGRVFDDLNRNGYADDGEPGLPGVRVATVKGLLITTDKKGRFHVPCAEVPDAATGSNFLMKLDTRTLPTGYIVTSENPRDVRLTRGKITKLNFGASILRDVALDLEDAAFIAGKIALKPEWSKGVERLMAVLRQEPSVLKIRMKHGAGQKKLAAQRLAAVKKLIERSWQKSGGKYRLVISTQMKGSE